MPIWRGDTSLIGAYRGSTALERIYHGSTIVFDDTEETDEHWANVALLISGDGIAGGQTITDESPSAHTVTRTGCTTQTDHFKYGTASVLYGNADHLSIPFHTDWDLSPTNASQFTIECWTRPNGVVGFKTLVNHTNPATNLRAFDFLHEGTEMTFFWAPNPAAASQKLITSGAAIASNGAFYHVAVCKNSSGKYRIFVDGVMKASSTPADSTFDNVNIPLQTGRTNNFTNDYLGYVDELRITKGVCRYDSDSSFTPPTAAFPRS